MLTVMESIILFAPFAHALINHSNGAHMHGNYLLDRLVRIIRRQGHC